MGVQSIGDSGFLGSKQANTSTKKERRRCVLSFNRKKNSLVAQEAKTRAKQGSSREEGLSHFGLKSNEQGQVL